MVGTYQTAMAEDAKARGESADLVGGNLSAARHRPVLGTYTLFRYSKTSKTSKTVLMRRLDQLGC